MQTYKLLEGHSVLLNQPKLIDHFGRSGSQLICQIHYWIKQGCGMAHDGAMWIYNTEKEWGKQIRLSDRQIRHYINKLSNLGILIVKKLKDKKYDRTNYITINYETLNKIVEIKSVSFSHEEETSLSKGKKLPLHIKNTKITNKDINKSEGGIGSFQISQHTESKTTSFEQVEQVKKNNLKNKKIEDHSSQLISPPPLRDLLDQQQNRPLKVNTAKEMIDIWNTYFQKSKTTLTKDLSKNLVAAFNLKFNSDMELWKNYLKRIESSSYLMGEGFNLSLYWALKFTTIDRVGKLDFGVKYIPFVPSQESLEKKALIHIQSIDESDLCKNVRLKLLKVIGAASYLSWFTKALFVEKGRVFQMKAETPFVEDYITTHYGYLFK